MSSSVDEEEKDPLLGRVIQDRFKVLKRLAAGGMGVVYKAEQVPLGRPVALKILKTQHHREVDTNFSKRFFLEASALAGLSHPNTVVVHDYGRTEDGIFFIAMEYLSGGTLAERLRTVGCLTPAAAIHVAVQICSSLADAHQQGLVHRDLKPCNVMFAPQAGNDLFVKVMDFGLVKMQGDRNLQLTQSGVMMGSPRYMAPEQVTSDPVDQRTDIYSFGAVLYHMLTGAPPFSEGSAYQAMTAHIQVAPKRLRESSPDCRASNRLEAVVLRCLAKDPANRFQGMPQLLDALMVCMQEAGPCDSLAPGAAAHVALSGSFGTQSGESFALDAEDTQGPHGTSASTVNERRSSSDSVTVAERHRLLSSLHPSVIMSRDALKAPHRGGLRSMALAWGGVAFLGMLVMGGVLATWFFEGASDSPPVSGESSVESRSTPSNAPSGPHEVSAVVPAPTETSPVVDSEDQGGGREVAPHQVRLISVPAYARVQREGVDLGDTPLTVSIPDGDTVALSISLPGYQTREIQLGAAQETATIHLHSLDSPAPESAPSRHGTRGSRRGASGFTPDRRAPDLANPWSNRP